MIPLYSAVIIFPGKDTRYDSSLMVVETTPNY